MYHILCMGFLMQKSITTSNGHHKVIGQGPPVLLSSGMYGVMPSFMYNDLIHKLKTNLTLVLPNGKPILSDTVNEIKEVLNVDKIGFLSHSSFDEAILENKNVEKAVIMDPIAIPTLSFPFLQSRESTPIMDTLLIETELSNMDEKIQMDVNSNSVIKYDNVGHGDILDDMWADLVNKFGMKGASKRLSGNKLQNFESWKFDKNAVDFKNIRKTYRNEIANEIIKHFLHSRKLLI